MSRVLQAFSAGLALALGPVAPAGGEEAGGSPQPLVTARPRDAKLANRGAVVGLDFSPDGKTLATGSGDGMIRIWEVRTGKALREIRGHGALVHSLCFSTDGRRLASGSHDGTARLWEAATGEEVMSVTNTGNSLVHSVALSPDGKVLALGSDTGGFAGFFEIPGGKCVLQSESHHDRIPSVCFSPDGTVFVTGSHDGMVKVNDLRTLRTRTLEDSGQRVHAVCFSPDGRLLATGGWNNQAVCLWEVGTWRMIRQLEGHTSGVVTLGFSPDGRILASGSHDGTARLWDVALGTEALRLDLPGGKVHAVRISPGGTLAAGQDDGTVLLWDLARGTPEEGGAALAPEAARALWEKLGDADPAVAYEALGELLRSRASALAFLKTAVAPAGPGNADRAAALIAQLDDDRYEAREEASRALGAMGRAVEPALRKALAETPSPEVKARVQALLEALDAGQMAEPVLRRLRAVHLLAWIGTSEARAILEVLGRGVATDPGTQEALAALERMAASPKE